jgi:hypothetical protein
MMLVEVSCVDAIVRKPMAPTLALDRGVLLGAYDIPNGSCDGGGSSIILHNDQALAPLGRR